MPNRRSGLWAEIALALALITLATILLNAGVFWMLLRQNGEDRRTELALALSNALADQLSVVSGEADRAMAFRRVMGAYRDAGLGVDELYVVDAAGRPMVVVTGVPPETPDPGMRAALFGRGLHMDVVGPPWGDRVVQVTAPVPRVGRPVGALRVRMPLTDPGVFRGPAGFVLTYTGFSGLAIALFGFSLFRRRLLRPVAALQAGTHRIAAGDFGHAVTLDAARELEELCGALNTMSASLAAYRSRTAEQLDRLETANVDLRTAQEALVRSEKLAGVGRLAAGLAHEVGNPLAAVLGYIELLQQGLGDAALEADLIARSRKELERIHLIIRQLLGYARLDGQETRRVHVAEALMEAVATVSHQPAFRDVDIQVHCPDGLPEVKLQPARLQQVLVNLLLNAADAVAAASPNAVLARGGARVVLEAELADVGVRVRCLDTGDGFSSVALNQAFEPFFTTKDVGAGTGLGLATCLQVIEASDGRITVGNRKGGGAQVELWLPAVEALDAG